MASAALDKELVCSICLDLYTDPVTLRCGHNFCRVCIDRALKIQHSSGVYSCPECRTKFFEPPALQRNLTLCKMVENYLTTCGDDNVFLCTYCVDSPVPAVKSCLACDASFCDKHLRVHSKEPGHVLTDPNISPEKRKCPIHKKILEYYCTEDAACICVSCCLVGEHRGHNMESLDEASEKKKKKLKDVLQKMITKRLNIMKRIQGLKERKKKAKKKALAETARINFLFRDLRKHLNDLEKKVHSEITRMKEQVLHPLSTVIQKMKKEKDELYRKIKLMEELCNMTDPLTVLQEPNMGDLCDPEGEGDDEDTGGHHGVVKDMIGHGGSDEDTGGHHGVVKDTGGHGGDDEDTGGHHGVVKDTGGHGGDDEDTGGHHGVVKDTGGHGGDDRCDWCVEQISHLCNLIQSVNMTFYIQNPTDILLDINTASNNLLISDDLKTATWTQVPQTRPETAEKFQYFQVMSSSIITSGRHYWEVEVGRSMEWEVGVCYPSIDRRGGQSDIGYNNKSWGLYGGRLYNNQYVARHDSKMIQLPHQITGFRIRISVDYEAGALSFYEISCNHIRHLHTFSTTFTEPLHVILRVFNGSIKLSDRSENWNQ